MRIKVDLALITKASLFIAVFSLPLKTTISNLGILVLCFTSVVSFVQYGVEISRLKEVKFYTSSTILLYVPLVLGLLYAPDLGDAFDELERTIFFLIAPMVILRKDLSPHSAIKTATWGLLIGSLLCIIFLHSSNLYRYFFVEDRGGGLLSYYYTGNSFVAPLIDMHPVYLGSYFLMLAVLLGEKIIALKKFFAWVVFFLLGLTILFLSSRIVFLAGTIWATFIFFSKMKVRARVITTMVFLLGGLLFFTAGRKTYVYNKLVKGAIWELGNNTNSSNIDSKKKSDSRMARWNASLQVVMERPMFGHGTGTEQSKLLEVYSKTKMQISKEKQFNAHNQFLGYALQFGFVGVLMLICYFGLNYKNSLAEPNIPLLGFCIIVFCCCLTENYLIRNMGVNFVAIFGSILHLKVARG